MSKAGLEKLMSAMADEMFRRKVKENPDTALAGYDLTPDEKAAIKRAEGQGRAPAPPVLFMSRVRVLFSRASGSAQGRGSSPSHNA